LVSRSTTIISSEPEMIVALGVTPRDHPGLMRLSW
jgi:hypothetical protein